MAFDGFLKLAGIEGESQDSKHANEIELLSYQFGAQQSGTAAVGGGMGAGKVSVSDLQIVKRTDKSTPKLFLACCTGEHIPNATLTLRKAGTSQQEYLIVNLTDILVSHLDNGGSTHSDIPTETVSLNFTKIEIQYQQQKQDGTLAGTIKTGYDIKKNQKV
jgi:type VI secretion system secreted protein Hcp